LLARDLARLAADAHRGVCEESLGVRARRAALLSRKPRRLGGERLREQVVHHASSLSWDRVARSPCRPTGRPRTGGRSRGISSWSGALESSGPLVTTRRPRLQRPGSMLPVRHFDSWIETLGSATNEISSL